MLSAKRTPLTLVVCAALASVCASARAAERVTLRSGSQFDCLHREVNGDRVRLYLISTARPHNPADRENYVEVPATSVLSVETIPDPVAEAALAHVVPDKVIAAYKRTSFIAMRRELLAGWADALTVEV